MMMKLTIATALVAAALAVGVPPGYLVLAAFVAAKILLIDLPRGTG